MTISWSNIEYKVKVDRKALIDLHSWEKRPERKPLLLRGARQVGKTWLVRQFAKSFSSFVEINLEARSDLHSYFDRSFGEPLTLVQYLSADLKQQIIPGKTLLFLDEIQDCPNALMALRYFKEKLPELHVIAAGSLLEFALKELRFPVGRLETLFLFPMTFEEFLIARGRSEIIELLRKCIHGLELLERLQLVLKEELAAYHLVGGMPEVVANFIKSDSTEHPLAEAQRIQQQLISNFRSDFNKYGTKAKIPYMKLVFDQVPRLLGKKFIYSHVSSDVKSRELSEALNLLQDAGLMTKSLHSSGNGVPLSAEASTKKFKVFCLDIGLTNRTLGLQLSPDLLLNPENIVHRGGLAEQFVAQELIAMTSPDAAPELYYWHREEQSAKAEVDFLVSSNADVIPIEVKSGSITKAKSLGIFSQEKKSETAILVSRLPFSIKKREGLTVISLPHYMLFLLKEVLQKK